jgi:hypothetical protein
MSGHKGTYKVIVGDFNISLSLIDHPDKKIKKKTAELNYSIIQMNLTDTYSIFHPKASEHKSSQNSMELSPK